MEFNIRDTIILDYEGKKIWFFLFRKNLFLNK